MQENDGVRKEWSESEKRVAKQLDRIEKNQPILSVALFIAGLSVSTMTYAAINRENPVVFVVGCVVGLLCFAVSMNMLKKYERRRE